MLDVFF